MITIDDISFREYFEREDKYEYDFLARYGRAFTASEDTLGIGDVMQLSFGLVKDIQADLEEGIDWQSMTTYLSLASRIEIKLLTGRKFLEICKARSYLVTEIERLIELERRELSHAPTSEEINAGIEDLGYLSIYLQMRSIATTFSKSIEEIRAWTYEACFTELVASKRLYEYDRRLIEIRRPKTS